MGESPENTYLPILIACIYQYCHYFMNRRSSTSIRMSGEALCARGRNKRHGKINLRHSALSRAHYNRRRPGTNIHSTTNSTAFNRETIISQSATHQYSSRRTHFNGRTLVIRTAANEYRALCAHRLQQHRDHHQRCTFGMAKRCQKIIK